MACIQSNTGQTQNSVVFFGAIIPVPSGPGSINFMSPFNYLSFFDFPIDDANALYVSLLLMNGIQINKISISIAVSSSFSVKIPINFGIIIGTGDVLKVSKQSPTYKTSLTFPANQTYTTQEFNNVNIEAPANSWMFVIYSFNESLPSSESNIFLNVGFG
jgi:hypothetical protein